MYVSSERIQYMQCFHHDLYHKHHKALSTLKLSKIIQACWVNSRIHLYLDNLSCRYLPKPLSDREIQGYLSSWNAVAIWFCFEHFLSGWPNPFWLKEDKENLIILINILLFIVCCIFICFFNFEKAWNHVIHSLNEILFLMELRNRSK